MNLDFFLVNIGAGIGLAMDAFSVSLTNGLNEPKMKTRRMCLIAGVFALFQFIMPFTGWVCVTTIASFFEVFQRYIPVIALILLLFIGGKMLIEGIKGEEKQNCKENKALCLGTLLLQGVATSIDALSVGFTISDYSLIKAVLACLLIGTITFIICFAGIIIGKSAGNKLSGKAGILGGVILIIIGIKIFVEANLHRLL